MVENAEKMKNDGLNDADPDGVTAARSGTVDGDSSTTTMDSTNRVFYLPLDIFTFNRRIS